MILLALPLLAASPVVSPPSREFWRVDPAPAVQPVQTRVAADLVGEGRYVIVYREQGYHFSTLGEDDEKAQVAAAIRAFDQTIYPRQVELFGPCPDHDGNGKVIVLITRLSRSAAFFFPFDEMSEAEALRYGFHSNQGEVLYHSFGQQGNRSVRNIASLAYSFHRLLHYARKPADTSWSTLLGNYSTFLSGEASARVLWGDADPTAKGHSPDEPWDESGWPVLFVQYLRERLGDDGLREIVNRPEPGFAALAEVLARRGLRGGPFDALADFAMACWLDDPGVGDGRFAFSGVVPPRAAPLARLPASRPTSGQTQVGVGGAAYIQVEGDNGRPLPLTLRGDSQVSWVARAVHLRGAGPDAEAPLAFDASGVAHLDLAFLRPGDALTVAVVPEPADLVGLDDRRVSLQWGLGWVPQAPPERSREAYLALLAKALPDGGMAARARLWSLVLRLAGETADGQASPITTRYAWAPEARAVPELLKDEAAKRGLAARFATFLRVAPSDLRQEWANVIIELPGSDPRRWPVVLAAHWDGGRVSLEDSYLRALNVEDDASGVAVAIEAAAALSRVRHRAPIVVALLAGGRQGAAGGHALLEQLQGRVADWIELDGVGTPEAWPRHLAIRLESQGAAEQLLQTLTRRCREVGLAPRTFSEFTTDHTAAASVATAGAPVVVVRTREGPETPAELDTPVAAELKLASPEFMVLLTKALVDTCAQSAGAF